MKIQSIALNTNKPSDEPNDNDSIECDFEEVNNYMVDASSEPPINQSDRQLIRFEYHVLYHISYGVPYLCFNAFKSSMLFFHLDLKQLFSIRS